MGNLGKFNDIHFKTPILPFQTINGFVNNHRSPGENSDTSFQSDLGK